MPVAPFIDSPFCTKAEYQLWLDKQEAALPPNAAAAAAAPVAVVSIGVAYTKLAVESALVRAGWTICNIDDTCATPTLHWSDFSAVPWDSILDGLSTASVQYLKTGLVRKADLLHYMAKHGAAGRFPPTIVGDIEDDDDVDEFIASWRGSHSSTASSTSTAASSASSSAADSSTTTVGSDAALWLLKPSRANRGEGIAVLKGGDETALRAAIAAHPRHRDWLLQRYVLPLLLPCSPQQQPPLASPSEQPASGLKCHLRLHVLTVGALSVWGNNPRAQAQTRGLAAPAPSCGMLPASAHSDECTVRVIASGKCMTRHWCYSRASHGRCRPRLCSRHRQKAARVARAAAAAAEVARAAKAAKEAAMRAAAAVRVVDCNNNINTAGCCLT